MSRKNHKRIRFIIVLSLLIPFMLKAQQNESNALNNLDKSYQLYKSILKIDSNNYAAFNNIGNICFLKGILDSAETSYLRAITILDDSLNIYDNSGDRHNFNLIQKHQEGILLNLGTLYSAIDSAEKAYEMYSKVVKDSSDIPKVRKLLGLPFEKEDNTLARKPDISAAKVEFMISETAKKGKEKKKDEPKEKKPDAKGKKVTKNLVRKGTKPEGKVTDVFYWIY